MTLSEQFNPLLSIHEVSIAMNSTLDPDGLLDLILDRCIEYCGVESGSLMLINLKEDLLDIVTSRGLNPDVKKEVKLKIGQGVTGLVASTGKGKLINDVLKDPNYIAIKKEIKSELAVPMIVEDVVIGVISLDSNRIGAFTQEHLTIVSILANQAAQIFKNLQTFRHLEQKNKIQQVLIEISKVVTMSLDMDEIFSSIMAVMERSLKFEKGSLVLYNPEEGVLKLVAAVGLTPDEMERGTYQSGEGVTGKVFETGEPMIVNSVGKDPLFLNRVGYLSHFKINPENISFLSVPVKSELAMIGVLSVFFAQTKHSDLQTHLDFLQVVASIISQAIKIHHLVDEAKKEIYRENILLKRELKQKYKFGSLIGHSLPMEKLFEKIQLVADSRASVLITGESGTGKEMIASAIHYNSNRSEKPFIKINCAAIPEHLLESELFGHKKGSFTGAVSDKKGKFELADGGTIFLDEIGELDLNLQSKLLRVLQEREIESIGSLKPKQIDIRILAATNNDLEKQIQDKKFRSDLFYRLNVVNLKPPPLRERIEDIPLLISHFIEKYSKENNKNVKGITRDANKILSAYTWPGNVRELENVIERAIVLTQNEILDVVDFTDINEKLAKPILVTEKETYKKEYNSDDSLQLSRENLDALDGRVLEAVVEEVEMRLIQFSMKKFKYTKSRVAKYLGINRNTLDKKIKDLKIEY